MVPLAGRAPSTLACRRCVPRRQYGRGGRAGGGRPRGISDQWEARRSGCPARPASEPLVRAAPAADAAGLATGFIQVHEVSEVEALPADSNAFGTVRAQAVGLLALVDN